MASKTQDRTYSVVQAGLMAGLGRNASYRAANTGQMPTIKLGRKLRVPALLWRSILDGAVSNADAGFTPDPLLGRHHTSRAAD